MKRVRILLRVSSEQQLEADGDLSIQRTIVHEYIEKHEEWFFDGKEYFEGGVSGYKNTSADREALQVILQHAKDREFDILVLYKDDRAGRLLFDTPQYIMKLKEVGVDVYSVKDGCLSPEVDDIMGQMMLTIRYANAQKMSADTGMRVKDTAQKLVKKGKFMGGKAPFGYSLQYSGEISKHGRALKSPVIVPEQAEAVRYIYDLSLNKEYGSAKIARELNLDERYKTIAPIDIWKSGTITSILTNPIYAGHVAYKRRERVGNKCHRLGDQDWIVSDEVNEKIAIIDENIWNRTQDKRKQRADKYIKKLPEKDVTVIRHNNGMLPLIDVIYCGYCGCKFTNGSRYNYWVIKDTGEHRTSKIPIYRCHNAVNGIPHDKTKQFRADRIEPIIFKSLAAYIGKIQEDETLFEEIENNHNKERGQREAEINREKFKLGKIQKDISSLEDAVPSAIRGEGSFSQAELAALIKKQKDKYKELCENIKGKEEVLKQSMVTYEEWGEVRKSIPTWQDVFLNADAVTKRVLVNKLIERIEVTKEKIIVRYKVSMNEFVTQPRISSEPHTTPYKPCSR